MRKYLCGVPSHKCGGSNQQLASISGYTKAHSTSEEAFKCYARFLVSEGYTKIGEREYQAPNGGPVRLLTKKSRFGTPLRRGKNVEAGSGGKRMMPLRVGGCIHGC